MAEGIRKRHSKGCSARDGGRCNCRAGYEAWVFSKKDDRKIRRTFARKSEARTWRTDALRALRRDELTSKDRDNRTLSEALEQFIEGMGKGVVRPRARVAYKPNTIRSYERAHRVHIVPSTVGRLKVADVQRRDLQGLADELLAKGLAVGTVSNVFNPIQAFYRQAVYRGDLARNPAEGIDLPSGRSGRLTRIASPSEAAVLLGALAPEDQAVWATAFYAGLRRGELQALRCCDLDFEDRLIQVERGWDQEKGAIDPKSRSGRRAVPMLAILQGHLEADLRRTARSGADLIFGRTPGTAFVASTIDNRAKNAWRVFNEREGEEAVVSGREPDVLRPITLHECRHTFASLLIDAGANPKAIQTFMGHSKIQTTFDIYGHLLPGSHDEVREQMDAYLANGMAPSRG